MGKSPAGWWPGSLVCVFLCGARCVCVKGNAGVAACARPVKLGRMHWNIAAGVCYSAISDEAEPLVAVTGATLTSGHDIHTLDTPRARVPRAPRVLCVQHTAL